MSNTNLEIELPPFGWYPDPADSAKLRWWDGGRWTERTEYPRPELQPAFGYSSDGRGFTRQHDYV